MKNGYTADSIWRNRDAFLKGTDEIVDFLTEKWSVENGYRLRKELFAFTDNKVSHVFLCLFFLSLVCWLLVPELAAAGAASAKSCSRRLLSTQSTYLSMVCASVLLGTAPMTVSCEQKERMLQLSRNTDADVSYPGSRGCQ